MSDSLQLIDFHRNTFTITADESGEHKTFLIPSSKDSKVRLFCSCSKKGYAQCENARKLLDIYNTFFKEPGLLSPTKEFEKSIFWSLIEPVTRFSTNSVFSIKVFQSDEELTVSDQQNRMLFHFYSKSDDRQRLLSRISPIYLSRFTLMNMAAEFVQSEQERALAALGHKTQRQMIEDGFWYRLAYHCYREYSIDDCRIEPFVDRQNGAFSLRISYRSELLISMDIPAGSVPYIFEILIKSGMVTGSQISKDEAELYFRIWKNRNEIYIGPVVKDHQNGLVDIDSKFVYGSYLFLPQLNNYLQLSYSSMKLIASGFISMKKLKSDEFSPFLEKHEEYFSFEKQSEFCGTVALDLFNDAHAGGFGRILQPQFIDSFERMELNPVSMDEKNCVLAVSYCNGDLKIDLSEMLIQKRKKNRFLYTDQGIIDLKAEKISSLLISAKNTRNGTISLANAALLQFRGTSLSTRIQGEEKLVSRVRQILKFKPVRELEPLEGLNCNLREYQKLAVQWLFFLYDNHFGGLLCDEMGLGKTIQIIAWFLGIKKQRSDEGAFLVVCPTSVISHWKRLLEAFTPSLKVKIYHSAQRDAVLNEPFDVLLTSYGIMRNDWQKLAGVKFDLTVFDEVHQLKNKETLSSQAALGIAAHIKIGITGTPIENRISDLMSLFDLVMPGLFNEDNFENEQFIFSLEQKNSAESQQLKRLISPFIMRRLKQTVLKELPEKIEDIRSCSLSDTQHEIYEAAVRERGGPIIEQLKNSESPIPYMHIFSLFSFLKQVCNHPALVTGKVEDYDLYQSGKWELFTELLDESLESDQKVVIFSQFLGMVEIIRLYLTSRGIGHVVLTGSTTNREQVIKKFAEDNECKVFVGSLMAGGVGIDLVAGSVVIHYDRWWNPAREDQATDRVHRFGQKRVVQVFKMVTEGTLEERIADVIERKKELSRQMLVEDSAESLKCFSREELLELFSSVY